VDTVTLILFVVLLVPQYYE